MASESPLVLVTGASGFIATHVVQQLQEQGYRVRGTVRSLQNATKVEPLRQLCPTAKYPIELVEADLLKEDSWPAAVKDCQYVMHVASPFPDENPKDEDDVLKPAVDGTLNVLRACHEVRSVKRVVVTSSTVAIFGLGSICGDKIYTEADWPDPEETPITYIKSKALSERAAWNYHAQLPERDRFELAVVNPSFVVGPVLCGTFGTTMAYAKRFLHHEMPLVPPLNFPCVDVRDVAAAHVAAMVVPEAAGHRHIVIDRNLWWSDIGKILDKEFGPQGYSVPTRTAPYGLLWLLSWFDTAANIALPLVGRKYNASVSRMTDVLKVSPRNVEDSWVDLCYSMIEKGFIKKTSKYNGPKYRSDC